MMLSGCRRNFSILMIAAGMMFWSACDLAPSQPAGGTPASSSPMAADNGQPTVSQTAAATRTPKPTVAPTSTPGQTATPTNTPLPTATSTKHHEMVPETPAEENTISIIDDADSSGTGSQGRANGGEDFNKNRYERPFLADGMKYLPDVDIIRVRLSRVDPWVYATFTLAGPRAEGIGQTLYGLEIDTNLDHRGEFLIWGLSPAGDTWTTEGVQVWKDANRDVGASDPQVANPVGSGNGYEQNMFDNSQGLDPNLAWIRRGPDPNQVQIAFKYSLIYSSPKYYWNAIADAGVKDHRAFDLNDHFTIEDAGSPLTELKSNYPLKKFFGFDNTCLYWVGVAPMMTFPWQCSPPLGAISGSVYQDSGLNGHKDFDDPGVLYAPVTLRLISCNGPVLATEFTGKNGTFYFSKLQPNMYCVTLLAGSAWHFVNTRNPAMVYVGPGEVAQVDFGIGIG
jgi:hypothetical protein